MTELRVALPESFGVDDRCRGKLTERLSQGRCRGRWPMAESRDVVLYMVRPMADLSRDM